MRPRWILFAAVVAATAGCGDLLTDAATRIANDLVDEAATGRSERQRVTVIHSPRAFPEGCAGAYTVQLQESLHHPASGGSLIVECDATGSTGRHTYYTTYHLNAVRVPATIEVAKAAGQPLRITLERRGGAVDVVSLQ